jgi:hypothetical protein
MKRFLGLLSVALLTAVPFASATTISLTFEEFAYGSSIGECYNGGRDSLNRFCGNDYGLSFKNESVRYTPSGAYLTGRVQLAIDPNAIRAVLGSDKFYITFTGSNYGLDPVLVPVSYEDGTRDLANFYIDGVGNPYCAPRAEDCVPYYGSTGSYRIAAYNGVAHPTLINFYTDRLDNIQFHSYTGDLPPFQHTFTFGSAARDVDIPEPSSIALVVLGAALVVRRRRNK